MKVLVTGGTSLLGAGVADRLAERGDTVTVLQRRPAGLRHREVLADIADRDAVIAALRGHDAVVHLAANVETNPAIEIIVRDNVVGTYNVFEAARAAGVKRVVFASSGATVTGYEREAPLEAVVAGRYGEVSSSTLTFGIAPATP